MILEVTDKKVLLTPFANGSIFKVFASVYEMFTAIIVWIGELVLPPVKW